MKVNRHRACFVRDALTNPEHIKFALKGCLAASLCYIILHGPGLEWDQHCGHDLHFNCSDHDRLIASKTGFAFRRRFRRRGGQSGRADFRSARTQFNRRVHAPFHGGYFCGRLDRDFQSTPVLLWNSIRLAFYIINLQDFGIQTSLVHGRDRVIGIMLGLIMMWLVFDQLWSAPTAIEMRKTFHLRVSIAGAIRQRIACKRPECRQGSRLCSSRSNQHPFQPGPGSRGCSVV